MSNLAVLLAQLAAVEGAKFASFTYRSKESNELARYTIVLGANFHALYEKDRDTLRDMLPSLEGLSLEAGAALLKSVEESLAKGLGNNSAYTHGPEKGDTYVHLQGIDGVSVNKNDGILHVKGLLKSKVTLEEGTWPEVKSRPLTLAKNAIRKALRQSSIRQFALPNVKAARLNGETLELD